jgi:hypothetical protein
MAARGNFLHQFGAGAHEFANQEKCRAYGVAVEQFDEARSDGRIRPIVKRERDLPRGGCVPQRRPKQFGRRRNRTPRGNPRGGQRGAGRDDGQKIQNVSTPLFSHGRAGISLKNFAIPHCQSCGIPKEKTLGLISSTGFSLCSFDFRLPQIKTTQAEACATEKPQAEA